MVLPFGLVRGLGPFPDAAGAGRVGAEPDGGVGAVLTEDLAGAEGVVAAAACSTPAGSD